MSTRLENRKIVARAGVRQEHPVDASLVGDSLRVIATNGTTAVNVFGSKGAPFDITITGIYAISKDTTAGNITLANAGNTVSAFAKGTTAGAVIGEDGSLANTTVYAGNSVTIVSSSAGDVLAFITYTVN